MVLVLVLMLLMMMMMMMIMIMIMTIVSVEQRPGWGEHVILFKKKNRIHWDARLAITRALESIAELHCGVQGDGHQIRGKA